MWDLIADTIVKYWVQFGMTLLGGAITLVVRRCWKRYKADSERANKEHYAQLQKDIKEENQSLFNQMNVKYDSMNAAMIERYTSLKDDVTNAIAASRQESERDDSILQNQIDSMKTEINCIKAGMLSMQGKEFRAECRKLLEEDHQITLDEWEELDADHDAYNGLGGNHRGDNLYALVRRKAENQLSL